ncbi:MAG: 3-dehydroquinate dehydratase [Methanonatronarchaeales archaeon]|nr:3-dehydroquinate dehydratase [Methanonatronarchaeales archaeon]
MDPELGLKGSVSTVELGPLTVGERPLVCASVASPEPGEMVEKAADTGADIVELRVDTLDDPGDPELERLLAASEVEEPLLLTVRWESDGGEYRGDEEDRIERIEGLMEHVDAVDIELEAEEESRRRVRKKARELGTPLIVSFHDFSETSSREELTYVMEQALDVGDIAKVAVTPRSRRDVLTLLEATLDARETLGGPVSSLAMGEIGSNSRIVAPMYGSSLTYAATGEPVAPGQLSVEETKEGLRLLGLLS